MNLETWSFDNDELFDLVKTGCKTATCSLYLPDIKIPTVGEESIIQNSHGEQIKIKLINVSIRRFCDIDSDWAKKEGEGDLFIVATDDDKIIGQVIGGSIQSKECNADTELHGMYIDTSYIGKGVGKLLFQEFAKRMKSTGARTFGLMCFSDNESMKFYKHMGGVVTIERPSSEKFENTMGSFLEFNIDEVLSK